MDQSKSNSEVSMMLISSPSQAYPCLVIERNKHDYQIYIADPCHEMIGQGHEE